jgi:hypothetical protein
VTIIDLPSTNLRPPSATDRELGILLRDGALIDWQAPMGVGQPSSRTRHLQA